MRIRISAFLWIGCILCVFAACKDEPESPPRAINLVLKVQQCARLHTAEYTIHKIVTYDDVKSLKGNFFSESFDIKLPLGDRKVAIPVDVTLRAYIDFSHFDESRIERRDRKISVTLPDPKVVVASSKVDHAGIREFVGLVRSRFSDEELTRFARQGEEQILAHIENYGILEMARGSAVRVLTPLLNSMGYASEDITIRFRPDLDADELFRHVEHN